MTLLQLHTPAAVVPPAPARSVRLRFHDAEPAPVRVAAPRPTRPTGPTGPTSPSRGRAWTASASGAALDLALDRLIDDAARELRANAATGRG